MEDIAALTPMQEGMLYHYLKDPGSDFYFEQLSVELSGKIERHCFEQACNRVIETNEMLRTVFRWEKLDNPVQVVLKDHRFTLRYRDFSNARSRDGEEVDHIRMNDRQEKFDLREVPFRITLCKKKDRCYELIISNHHILYDGWSTGIILKELLTAYSDLVNKRIPARPVKTKFKEFVRGIHDKNKEEEERYWKNYLQGFDTSSGLSIKKRAEKEITEVPAVKHYQTGIDKDTGAHLDHYLKKYKITAASLLYGAWGVVLQRYNNSDDVVFGVTISGRNIPLKGIEEMVGLFINTLPLRAQVVQVETQAHAGEKVHEFLSRINRSLQVWEKYETSSLVDIKKYGGAGGSAELFDTLMVIENYPLDRRLKQPGNELSPVSYSVFERTHYDLTVGVTLPDDREGMGIDFYYRGELFDSDAIQRLALHYNAAINNFLKNPDQEITAVELLSLAEKQQLLFDFNDIGPGFPWAKTIPQLFEEQVRRTPDRIALSVGPVGNVGQVSLSYNELNEQSGRLAGQLVEKGVLADNIVGIMRERSIDLIIGILGILKTGGAYLPINPGYPQERIDYMLKDSAVKILVDEKFFGGSRGAILQKSPPCNTNLAYIIYTSGSTGQPKGVPVAHANLSPLLHWGYRELGITPHDRTVQNLSYFFDWSVWEIFITLTSGAGLYMVSGEVVPDAERYLDFICRHAITVLHITPTHFQSMLHVSPRQRLKTLRYLCIGAEKLNCDLVERSYTWIHEDCRVFNMYGPTEATIMAAVLEIDKPGLSFYRELSGVPIGKTLGNNFLSILDRHMHPCPLFVPGELYIGGAGVAAGYLNNPELTAEKFNRSYRSYRTYIFYKTGDLARWLPAGTVEFLGRIDQQVKIRGFRIEPGEIENRLLEHEVVKEALVIAREHKNGDKYLCAYIVPHPPYFYYLSDTLKEYLSGRLPEYMIPAYFIPMVKMPLNPNGKVDLNALPLPGPAVTPAKGYIAPGNDREKALADIWARVLGIDSAGIGIDDDFFELGGHSLNVTALIGRIHKELNIEVPFTGIFVSPTVRELAAYIGQKEESRYGDIPPVGKREYYPLSSAQKRLFVLQQMEPGCTAYNIHGILEMEGALDKEKLQDVFRQLIARHESLRTSFDVMAEEPVQRIHEDVEFQIEYLDLAAKDAKNREGEKIHHSSFMNTPNHFIRVFDLSKAPLLRVGLLKQEENKHLLMVDMHHIIADGASVNVLIKDFTALYNGEKLPALRIQYKDFTEWQNRRQDGEKIKQQEAFWLNEFAGEIPVLNLPVDYMRPLAKSFEGATLGFEIPAAQTRGIKELALETKTTLFMVLLAIYNIFLAKISGQEDIVVGTPAAGRGHPGIEGIIGMFVNTLPLRNFPMDRKSVEEFLSELKGRTLQAFENRDYLYDDLAASVKISRDSSRNPLFDTMFALQDLEISGLSIRGLKIKPYEYEENTAKFDLSLIAVEKGERLFFTFEYSTKLFRKDTLERFTAYFKQVVSSVLEDTQEKIAEIGVAPGHEIRQLLEVFNHPAKDYPQKTVMDLFMEQVDTAPHRIAGFHEGNYITYEELNNRADVLAKLIKEISL